MWTINFQAIDFFLSLPFCGGGSLLETVGPVLCCSHWRLYVQAGGPVCTAGICTAARFRAEWPAAGIPPPSAPPAQDPDLWQIMMSRSGIRWRNERYVFVQIVQSFETDPGGEQTGALYEKMSRLFPESDVKTVHVQLSPETNNGPHYVLQWSVALQPHQAEANNKPKDLIWKELPI